jgi:prepilin-type N-terminal cleavage/methylation domain-containing protein
MKVAYVRRDYSLCERRRSGLSLVELLVVLGIVAILAALLLPAVQAARESARNAACKNHLKQLGIALAAHEAAYGQLPGGGWGFQWVGDPDKGPGAAQPGAWVFSLLPYLEAGQVHKMGRGLPAGAKADALGNMMQTPVAVFVCPSRRGVALQAFLGQFPLHNATKPALAFKNDYAGCGGHTRLLNGGGPANDSPQALAAYQWPDPDKATGMFYAGSQIRPADIRDGLSNTYAVGEKYVRIRLATTPQDRDFGDDQAAYIGDDRDVRRWTEEPPARDHLTLEAYDSFGSRHPASWNALFGDGSVRSMAYTIDYEVHRSLGNRRDKKPASVP